MAKAVIFDMDGELVDSSPLLQQAVIDTFASVGVQLTTAQAAEIKGLRVDVVVAYWYKRYPWRTPSKAVIGVPVLMNTGARVDNITRFLNVADEVIVGSSLKVDGQTWNPVDPARVEAFLRQVQLVRHNGSKPMS